MFASINNDITRIKRKHHYSIFLVFLNHTALGPGSGAFSCDDRASIEKEYMIYTSCTVSYSVYQFVIMVEVVNTDAESDR